MGFDIIGDVHGKACELKKLLSKLGYEQKNGFYQHNDRQVIFIGDLIDRGKHNIEVIKIARSMTEAGAAKIIMGNHEYNAICYHTPDGKGGYLREHTEKNNAQHEEFLKEFSSLEDGNKILDSTINWFKTIPLFLDLKNLRLIHACWNHNLVNFLKDNLNPDNTLTEEFLFKSTIRDSPEYKAIEILLKGPEIKLPNGLKFRDGGGVERSITRLKWWVQGQEYLKLLANVPNKIINTFPEGSVVPEVSLIKYGNSEKPLLFGHYWMKGKPKVQSNNLCCVDYSQKETGGKLCAYRFNGEQCLSSKNIVYVSTSS